MSAEHNHPPFCCCSYAPEVDAFEPVRPCPGCPDHGDLACLCGTPGLTYAGPERDCPIHGEAAGPYTEQETTK